MSTEKKLTAVEWLVENTPLCKNDFYLEQINQAKEKEKQQLTAILGSSEKVAEIMELFKKRLDMKTQKKPTAMQEFIDRLKNDFNFVVSNNVTEMYLEKEKQHLYDFYDHGYENPNVIGEQYYNETFKK